MLYCMLSDEDNKVLLGKTHPLSNTLFMKTELLSTTTALEMVRSSSVERKLKQYSVCCCSPLFFPLQYFFTGTKPPGSWPGPDTGGGMLGDPCM